MIKLWKKKKDFALAYYNKGIAYRTLKGEDNSRKALEMFELAIKYQNDYFSAYFNKGCILIELGEDIEAIHVFNKCKELLPEDDTESLEECEEKIQECKVKLNKKGYDVEFKHDEEGK